MKLADEIEELVLSKPGLTDLARMLGGPATYSGTPRPQAPGANPWGWLGSMGMPGGPGWGGGGTPR